MVYWGFEFEVLGRKLNIKAAFNDTKKPHRLLKYEWHDYMSTEQILREVLKDKLGRKELYSFLRKHGPEQSKTIHFTDGRTVVVDLDIEKTLSEEKFGVKKVLNLLNYNIHRAFSNL